MGTDGKVGEGLARCPEKHVCMFLKVSAGHSGTGLLQPYLTTEEIGENKINPLIWKGRC